MRSARLLVLAAPLALMATPALAHPGHEAAGFAAGLAHPFGGADHMLAMVAVGLWASLRGGKALWAWPAAFVAAMLAGYGLGVVLPGAPMVEPAILASVIVLGGLVAADVKTPFAGGVALIALFGLAHGYAHGAEAPADGVQAAFPLGFALATIALHGVGLVVGAGLMKLSRPILVRVLGAGTAAGGLLLAVAS